VAEKILYGAIDKISEKTKDSDKSIELLSQASTT